MKKPSKKAVSLTLLFLILFSIFAYCENNLLTVAHHTAENEKLPSDFDGFVIAQVSDFHNTKSKLLQNTLLSEIEKAQPDIIVITGDFIDSNRTDTAVSLAYAKKLLEIAPVYMSTGNHEFRSAEEYPSFEKALIDAGVIVLRNEAVKTAKGNSEINILGIDDPYFLEGDNKFDSTRKELESTEYDKELFTLTLAHRPEIFSVYVECEQDLVLSGHAHGGQFRLPVIGGLYGPTEGIFPEYSEGSHKENGTEMIISRGIGNSDFPLRLNNRPELIIITLHAE